MAPQWPPYGLPINYMPHPMQLMPSLMNMSPNWMMPNALNPTPSPFLGPGTSTAALPPDQPITPPLEDSGILEEFLEFAHVDNNSPQVQEGIQKLGITHWSMFQCFNANELVNSGMHPHPKFSFKSSPHGLFQADRDLVHYGAILALELIEPSHGLKIV